VLYKLATAARSVNDNITDERIKYENFLVMLITSGLLVAFSNDGIGFLTGMVGALLLALQRLGPQLWCERFMERAKALKPGKRQEDLVTLPSTTSSEESNADSTPIDVPRGASG
jgi:hypothetical protein